MVHKHGRYKRYADPAGTKKRNELEFIQRYLCCPCGLSFSVLLPHRLPYRPIRAERLQGDFDQRAGIQAQGHLIHNDDTTIRVQSLAKETDAFLFLVPAGSA